MTPVPQSRASEADLVLDGVEWFYCTNCKLDMVQAAESCWTCGAVTVPAASSSSEGSPDGD